MCKCTPIIRTPFCGRGNCLPPASREPTETLFGQSVLAEFDRRDQAERLDVWERGLDQYAHRSDSSGYAGRMGLEVLSELRRLREQADALADALDKALFFAGERTSKLAQTRLSTCDTVLRAYREANRE